ncbi:histidine phosphatase family protein [Deinococcus sp. Marseille-Q6407]|uniref:histidine phosphatase family protein n=1 Tax=Deinococcus sp. Marseille-Q6407 TaxID=2969223 RepID=UPI0021BE2401|nr:histidine phosphatase family protein [Deinococcus sp. Marseille-Q6407]
MTQDTSPSDSSTPDSSISEQAGLPQAGTLILIRHGRTALNAQSRFQGQTDTPLDATGQAQARATAQRLRDEGVRDPLILTSDLPRAVQTAEAVRAAVGGRLQTTPALREMAFGEWDQQGIEDIEARFPEEFGRFRDGDPSFTCPGGECGSDVADRAYAAVESHLPTPGETVVVVAHQLTIFALLTRLLGEDYQTVWPTYRFNHANAAFSRLSYQGGQVVSAELGVHDHLDHLTAARV